jgi:UTP--glucose-1-phosphate uridylyltransferase
MEILPHVEPGRGDEIQLTDALKQVLREEEIFAVQIDCVGYDTGNILSWLEANIALALETEEFGEPLRESLKRLLE